jgi:hypothetical protein
VDLPEFRGVSVRYRAACLRVGAQHTRLTFTKGPSGMLLLSICGYGDEFHSLYQTFMAVGQRLPLSPLPGEDDLLPKLIEN